MIVSAVCHVHSEWSYDGSWSLTALSTKFSQRGCRVLMTTEHDRGFTPERFKEYRRACAEASSEKILVVPGIEYSDSANRVHVLVWGPVPFLGESLPTDEMLEKVKSNFGVSVLAHPTRKGAWQCFVPQWRSNLLGIEAWNRKYDGWAPSDTASQLLHQSECIPFVGLDFHTQRQSFPLTMTLDVEGSLTEDSVLDCLRGRRCSPQAFGSPLGREVFRKVLPMMRIAERSRRTAARFARKVGVL